MGRTECSLLIVSSPNTCNLPFTKWSCFSLHVKCSSSVEQALQCLLCCFFTFLQDFLFLSSVSSSLQAPPQPVLAAIHKILDLLNPSSKFLLFSFSACCFQSLFFQLFSLMLVSSVLPHMSLVFYELLLMCWNPE